MWYNLYMKENKLLQLAQEFAVDIITVTQELKNKKEYNFADQIKRSGTSISANISEGNHPQSRADMVSELIVKGYEDKLLVSHDYATFLDFGDTHFEMQELNNRDFTTVHKKLFPALKGMQMLICP